MRDVAKERQRCRSFCVRFTSYAVVMPPKNDLLKSEGQENSHCDEQRGNREECSVFSGYFWEQMYEDIADETTRGKTYERKKGCIHPFLLHIQKHDPDE